MSELKVFDFKGLNVRTVLVEGNAWFVAKDVCKILELVNTSRSLSRLDDDEKGLHSVNTPGGKQQLATVNESGLYSLILTSRKQEAKNFKRWITHEVLPQIRQTGGYIPYDQEEDDEAFLARALVVAQKTLERKSKELQQAKAVIKLQEPKVTAYDYLMDNEGLINVGEFGKHFGFGRTTFFKRLRDIGLLTKQNGKNLPKEGHYRDCFELRRSRPNEKGISYPVTMIKSNMVDKLVKKLIKEGLIDSVRL